MERLPVREEKNILFAVLDWGLGHATRCMPLLRQLLAEGKQLHLASDGRAAALLSREFPELPLYPLPPYKIRYGKGGMIWNMARQMPRITYAALAEHRALRKIVAEQGIDMVVSDNRFGCFHPKVRSCFLSHQLNLDIPNPFFRFLGNQANRFWISRYDECWVPDRAGTPNLSGKLSHPTPFPGRTHYVGPLSRMRHLSLPRRYKLAIVLSGPEPQRSQLQDLLLRQLEGRRERVLLVQGKTELSGHEKRGPLEIVSHMTSEALNQAICSAEWVVCRSGYSTLMDLEATQSRALLIPTPGQTEQEYLARHFAQQGRHLTQNQNEVDLRLLLGGG